MIYTDKDDEKLIKIISKNIKYFRLNNNSEFRDKYNRITQERLAELCDLSTSFIGNIESSKVNAKMSITTLNKIAKVLNIEISELFIDRNL